MSDYWVSQQRHWCKYCKKYIQNNKPSIQLHENGGTHKGNVERFLRDVYRKGRENKEAAESTRLEIERIEREARKAAGLHYAPSVASSSTKPRATTTSSAAPSYPNVHIPTIEELREQAAAEQRQRMVGNEEWAVKADVAQVGEWEIVAPPPAPVRVEKTEDQKKTTSTTHDQAPELQDDDEGADEDLNNFKIKEKELPTDLAEEETGEEVTFKKRKLGGDNLFKSRKKKPLRKKD